MDVKYFDYDLPQELIAQTPLEKRSNSKLMVLDRKTGEIEHKYFYDIIDYLNENDVLVLNNTKVMPSRIYGEKVDTKAKIEFLLLKEKTKDSLCGSAHTTLFLIKNPIVQMALQGDQYLSDRGF